MADPALPPGFSMDQAEPALPAGFTADAPAAPARPTHDEFNAQIEKMVADPKSTKDTLNKFASDNGYTLTQDSIDRALHERRAKAITGPISYIADHFAHRAEDQAANDEYTRAQGGVLGTVGGMAIDARKAIDNVGSGLVEGLTALPDLAVTGLGRLFGAGARALGAPGAAESLEHPVTLSGAARAVTGAAEEPEGVVPQYIRAATRGLGGLVAGLGLGGSMAQSAKPVIAGVGRTLMASPGAQAAGALAGSAGGETARQFGASPTVQTISSLLAGGMGGVAAEGAGAAGSAARSTLTDRGAVIRAGETIAKQADDLPNALSTIDAATPQASGASPTLAEVSRDPGLAGFQRSFGSTNQKAGARISAQQQDNAALRVAAVDKAVGTGDTQAVQTAAQETGQALNTAARSAAEATGPSAYPETSGSTARQLLDAAHNQARDRTSAAYTAPELSVKTPVEIPDSFFQGLQDKLQTFYGDAGGTVPPEMSQIISDISGEAHNSNALTNIDRRLADFAGRMRSSGAAKEAAFAEGVRNDVAGVADGALPPEQRAALATAKAARREQGDLYENGQVGKAIAKSDFGRPAMPDSAIPQTLIPKGRAGGEAVTQLISSAGRSHAENIAREEIRRQMDGATDAAGAGRVARDFAPVLREFPELQSAVQSAHGQMALAEAFPRSPMGRFADWSRPPAQVVSTMLDAKDGGRAFTALVSSLRSRPAALDGLRRAVHDYVVDASSTSAVNAQGDRVLSTGGGLKTLRNALDRDKGAGLFTPPQRQALLQIQGEMEGSQFANMANRTAGSDTARNQAVSVAGKLAGHSRVVRVVRVVVDMLNNHDQTNALIGKAILDPKFAAELIRSVPQSQATGIAQRLTAGLVGSSEAAAAAQP